jgi:uncharacterized membrane protein
MGTQAYLRALGVGASCGLRTFTAPAVTLWEGGSTWAGPVAVLAAVELVADKLPSMPSRTRPIGLGFRIASGAFCGATLAGRCDGSNIVGAVCGAAAAVAAAFAGYGIRRYLTVEIEWPDLPVALIEDAIAFFAARNANAID